MGELISEWEKTHCSLRKTEWYRYADKRETRKILNVILWFLPLDGRMPRCYVILSVLSGMGHVEKQSHLNFID